MLGRELARLPRAAPRPAKRACTHRRGSSGSPGATFESPLRKQNPVDPRSRPRFASRTRFPPAAISCRTQHIETQNGFKKERGNRERKRWRPPFLQVLAIKRVNESNRG